MSGTAPISAPFQEATEEVGAGRGRINKKAVSTLYLSKCLPFSIQPNNLDITPRKGNHSLEWVATDWLTNQYQEPWFVQTI